MTKRIISVVLTVVVILGIMPQIFASAATKKSVYTVSKAISYADKNWNNGKGMCAEFVSRCLQAGGVDVFEPVVINLYNALNGTYGKAYKLKLTGGTSGRINMAANAGKIQKGDPVFYKCNYCGNWEHVVLCNGANAEGYSQDYAHNNAHNGKKTTYTYRHCGGESWSLYSIRMYEAPKLYGAKSSLQVPKVSSASNGPNGIVVKWSKTKDAKSYAVYRKTERSSWKKVGTTTSTAFTDKSCENGNTYFYTVKALNGKKVSQYYDGKSVKCLSLPVLKSISNGTSGITVNWQKVSSADGYYVYRKTSSTSWQRIATVKKGSTVKYTDKTAKTGTNYSYTVKAFDGKLNGSYNSKGINITRLTAPKNLLATSTDEGMQITFNYVKGANSYRVFRQTEKGKWQRIATVYSGSKGVKSYIDSDVTMGEEYTYTVRAVNGSSYSTYTSKYVTAKQIFDMLADMVPELEEIVPAAPAPEVTESQVTEPVTESTVQETQVVTE